MIDSHCHLEQGDYASDREAVIARARDTGLKAIVTCCARRSDLALTLELVERHKGFVFAAVGLHPEYVKEVSEEEVAAFIEAIKENVERIVAIGEVGLDYWWVKEPEWRERQKALFERFIALAAQLRKPLVIHARDAFSEAIELLECLGARSVLMHMFGANQLTRRVVDNNWLVSVNTIVLRSKRHRKVVRDTPLEHILLETDAPWLGPGGARNEPSAIRIVAQEVAAIKGIDFEKVWHACGKNAATFFNLPLTL